MFLVLAFPLAAVFGCRDADICPIPKASQIASISAVLHGEVLGLPTASREIPHGSHARLLSYFLPCRKAEREVAAETIVELTLIEKDGGRVEVEVLAAGKRPLVFVVGHVQYARVDDESEIVGDPGVNLWAFLRDIDLEDE